MLYKYKILENVSYILYSNSAVYYFFSPFLRFSAPYNIYISLLKYRSANLTYVEAITLYSKSSKKTSPLYITRISSLSRTYLLYNILIFNLKSECFFISANLTYYPQKLSKKTKGNC